MQHFTVTSLITALVAGVAMASPAMPLKARQDGAATVYFTPYSTIDCSEYGQIGSQINITSGHCYNVDATFSSFSEYTNFASGIPCALTIHSEADCQGTGSGTELSYQSPKCSNQSGRSLSLACGP